MRTSASSVTAHTDPPPAATPKRRPCSTGTVAVTAPDAWSLRVRTFWFGCVTQTPPSPTATHQAARKRADGPRGGRRVGVGELAAGRVEVEERLRLVDEQPDRRAVAGRARERRAARATWCCVAVLVAGSMRVASGCRKCATQTASLVTVICAGRLATGIVATTWFVAGSMRVTVACSSLATHTEPCPNAAES